MLSWPLGLAPANISLLSLWVPSRHNERPEALCVQDTLITLTIVCWRTQLFVTHNLSLVFKWLGDFWMPYSMIRSLSWMQSACTPPSQDEGPWCFDLRDDCWHCCCSSQGEEGACDQQHSYLSEVDQNTAQASAQALAQTGRIAWHTAWTRLTAVISSFIMSRAYTMCIFVSYSNIADHRQHSIMDTTKTFSKFL